MSNVTALPTQQIVDTRYTQDVIPILDTSKFEHMQRIAMVMAETSIIPSSLRGIEKNGNLVEFPKQVIIANCFRIVNQAVRWGLDPFAVADCASIIHGKLMWEGKLIAAVLDVKLGVDLQYDFDDKPNQELGVTVSGTLPGETKVRTVYGQVKDWHRGPKSPWANPGAWKRQMRYMGAREWARAHKPSVILGVYADDELNDIAGRDVPAGKRALRMKDVTPKQTEPQAVADLPDIPEEAPQSTQTDEARKAIADAISVEMLSHIRETYDEADWDAIGDAYDEKHDELRARSE